MKVKEEVFEHFMKTLFGVPPKEIASWEDIGQIGEKGLHGEEIEELIDFTLKKVKEKLLREIELSVEEEAKIILDEIDRGCLKNRYDILFDCKERLLSAVRAAIKEVLEK